MIDGLSKEFMATKKDCIRKYEKRSVNLMLQKIKQNENYTRKFDAAKVY